MALSLLFARHGSIHRPFYHLVAADSRKAPGKKYIEKLGVYDPAAEPSMFTFDETRVQFWYAQGAMLTNTVEKMLKKQKVKLERTKTATRQPKKKK